MVTRVAVTGAAGRIGRGVLDLLLDRGVAVVAIDSRGRPPTKTQVATWFGCKPI